MISLKKYLDGEAPRGVKSELPEASGVLPAALGAYGSAMLAMGSYTLAACPGLGEGMKQRLEELQSGLSPGMSREAVEATEHAVRSGLEDWGEQTARHYREKAGEVKELLLTIARTAEAVSARDQRCAGQMSDVTARLREIATLDDLTEIRASIEKSASELKSSIDRMAAEGKAAVDELKNQVNTYHAKLEAAEELALRDPLTGMRNRMSLEAILECRVSVNARFCVAMIDLDGFKTVNDTRGHLTGDELLKAFAGELRSACRAKDVVGRWGGDEFLILLDCELPEARAQVERVRKWVCGDYTLRTAAGPLRLALSASIGLAEREPGETVHGLIARADAAMYECKGAERRREVMA